MPCTYRIAIYGDDGSPVAPGGIGEIFVRQPALADFTYLNQDEKRRRDDSSEG